VTVTTITIQHYSKSKGTSKCLHSAMSSPLRLLKALYMCRHI